MKRNTSRHLALWAALAFPAVALRGQEGAGPVPISQNPAPEPSSIPGEPAARVPGAPRFHIAERGESPWDIFIALQSRERVRGPRWRQFLSANPGIINDRVFPGDQIVIPEDWPAPPGRRTASTAPRKRRPRVAAEEPPLRLSVWADGARPSVIAAPGTIFASRDRAQIPGADASPSAARSYLKRPSSPWTGAVTTRARELLLAIALSLLSLLLARRASASERVKWVLAALSLCVGARYLLWRGVSTLNMDGPLASGISLVLFATEIYGFLSVVFFYLQVLRPTRPPPSDPGAPERLPAVDIFVAIYNEPLEVLHRTLVGCMAVDYPSERKRVYVLDDGRRGEVLRLAEELGCGYITRPGNEHAKAGNLNNGLSRTDGEFVLFLDCDHIPVRTILQETIGHFQDPKVAFVQTPHYFYNPDTFQRNFRLEREVVNEQDLFFYVIEPGKHTYNSAFFAGSGGIFRRRALQSIGGIQVRTLTEDLHTSMVLHAGGWRSIYLDKILSAGLAPETYRSYLKQRQRWTRGGIQVFVLDNPLLKRGLSLMQRVQYLASIMFFFSGWSRFICLVAPLSFLLLGVSPVEADIVTLMGHFLPYYVSCLLAFALISGRFRNPFWSEVYEAAVCFATSRTAAETLLRPKGIRFDVTPKGLRLERSWMDWGKVLPHILLSFLLVAGISAAFLRLPHETGRLDATLFSAFWTAYNLMILAAAIFVARERPQKRSSHRVYRRMPCLLLFGGRSLSGTTSDMSETGLSLSLDRHALLPQSVSARLSDDDGASFELEAEVVRNDSLREGRANVGVRFMNIDEARRRGLLRVLYCSPASWNQPHRPEPMHLSSFRYMLTAAWRAFLKDNPISRRLSPRHAKRLSCEVLIEGRTIPGVTQDLSVTGMSVNLSSNSFRSDQVVVRLKPEGKDPLSLRGRIVRRIPRHGRGIGLGVRFLERKDIELAALAG